VIAGSPFTTVANAKARPSARQAPDELMNCRLSKCGSVAVEVSRRRISPVSASAMNSSMAKRVFSDRKATRLPSGLSDGATFRLPPVVLSEISSRPERFWPRRTSAARSGRPSSSISGRSVSGTSSPSAPAGSGGRYSRGRAATTSSPATSVYMSMIDWCHSAVTAATGRWSTAWMAASALPLRPAVLRMLPTTSSPYSPAT